MQQVMDFTPDYSIRNASTHSNCILNDLKARTTAHKTNTDVINELMMIPDMNSNFTKTSHTDMVCWALKIQYFSQ